jgi:outer membrane protein assembly factor BamA
LDIFSKDWYGFTPVLGGMVTGSGFGGGLQWMRRDLLDGKLMLRSSARISSRAYQLYDVEAGMPGLASDRVFLDLYLRHRNSPQLAYYGPGPGSHKQGRTDYRFEDTSYDLTGGVKPLRWVRLGGTVGYLQNNVGPGSSETYGSTERVYSPLLAPGIDRQTDFFRTGALAQIDYRDNPNGASSGGQYYARYDWYQDQELNRFSFRRMTAEAQQFVPLFNKKRVLAVRARTIFSYTDRNQRVPFYLQPSLGGSDDLRGYRAFRFYDNNSLVMNAEWRWEVLKSVEGAIFADAGKVFARPSDIDLAHLQASFGAGLRFRAPSTNAMILRLDGAISHEGFQLSLGFNDIFTSRVRTGRETSPLAGRLP